MNPRRFFMILAQLGLAGAVLLLSHYGLAWLAGLVVLAPAVYIWLRYGRDRASALAASPAALGGLSAVVLIGLSRQPIGQPVFPAFTQVVITLLYASWLLWLWRLRTSGRVSVSVLVVDQLLPVMAIFLAAAFWHWPQAVVVILVWVSSALAALWYLKGLGERAAVILALTWALVAAEVAWVLSIWQVNYILGNYLIVPQIVLILLGLGYCFASIYQTHSRKGLSRRRLIEYIAIAGILLAIVVAGTRWNGTA